MSRFRVLFAALLATLTGLVGFAVAGPSASAAVTSTTLYAVEWSA